MGTGKDLANRLLRARMSDEAAERGIALFAPPPELCTDNAAMIAAEAYYNGNAADMRLDAKATL